MGHSEMLLAVAGLKQDAITERTQKLAGGDWSMFTPGDRAAFAFARKQAKDPASITASDVQELIRHFGTERTIDIIWWSCRCHYMTRVADAFQLPLERENVFQGLAAKEPAKQATEKDDGFVSLFDGKDLAGWKQIGGKQGVWGAEDGIIVCKSAGGGWLSTEKKYADFILRLEYRMQPGGNSGVFIRAPHEGNPWITGMEIQLLDDAHPKYKNLKPYQYTGSIYGVVPPAKSAIKPAGQWNQIEIAAQGKKVKVVVNGEAVVEADLDQHKAAEKEHPGITRKEGHIGLQSHDDRIEFRNVRIRVLK